MNFHPWRIAFFGTPAFAVPILQGLLQGPDEVVAVVTQPDRERGRGRRVTASPVKELASRHHRKVLQPEKARDERFQEELRALELDSLAVAAYGQLLPRSILLLAKHGAVNVHASLLPKFRGAAPIPWVIFRGEKTTGVTTMMMDEGMDTGDILLQREIPVDPQETAETLHDKLAILGVTLLLETLAGLKEGRLHSTSQDHAKATYAPLLKKEDGRIDWGKTAEEIGRQVRAFCPWPGAFTELGGESLKIHRGEVRKKRGQERAGTILWVGSDSIEVATGGGSYVILGVQPEGKRRMSAGEFLAGRSVKVGTVLGEPRDGGMGSGS